jgi:hypothetical protein
MNNDKKTISNQWYEVKYFAEKMGVKPWVPKKILSQITG